MNEPQLRIGGLIASHLQARTRAYVLIFLTNTRANLTFIHSWLAPGVPEGGREFCAAAPFPQELLYLDPERNLYRRLQLREGFWSFFNSATVEVSGCARVLVVLVGHAGTCYMHVSMSHD